MPYFNVDINEEPIKPKIYLCKPDGTTIAKLNEGYNINLVVKLIEIDELTFDIPLTITRNNISVDNPHLDLIKEKYLIKLTLNNQTIYFVIEKITNNMTEELDSKQIVCYSLEYKLKHRNLHTYDTVSSKNLTTILAEVLADTNWTVNYIDSSLDLLYRSFKITNKTILDFIINDLVETFKGIPIFDTANKQISFYADNYEVDTLTITSSATSNGNVTIVLNGSYYTIAILNGDSSSQIATKIGATAFSGWTASVNGSVIVFTSTTKGAKSTPIYSGGITGVSGIFVVSTNGSSLGTNKGLSFKYGKYLKDMSHEYDFEEFCTRLKVFGKNSITINANNITGQNYIEDFSYFIHPFEVDISNNIIKHSDYMSDGLCLALLAYNNLITSNQPTFNSYLSQLSALEISLTALENELDTLNTEMTNILNNLAIAQENNQSTSALIVQRDAKQVEIDNKQGEIDVVNTSINGINNDITALKTTLSKTTNFTSTQLAELNESVFEKEIIEDNIDNAEDLYEYAVNKFLEIKTPPIIANINIVNLLEIIECQNEWDKLVIGDIINIYHEKLNVNITAKIIEIDYNFESGDISLIISNIERKLSKKDKAIKIINKTLKSTTSLEQEKFNWNTTVLNFDLRNDRISVIPADPIVANDGTAIGHTINTDGSCDISFEWTFTGTGDAYNIDGFIVYVRSTIQNESYIFGSTISREQYYNVNTSRRAYILYGVPCNQYYTFGVQAYRKVDADIDSNGYLKSNIIKSTYAGENPYLPSVTVSFSGDVAGTINGVEVITITDFIDTTTTFIDGIEQSDFQTQIDGKIETYYTSTDPNTWLEADRTKHTGDMWYNTSTKLLKRYNGTTNAWELIEDQKAIDAYTNASTAQDTADLKRRVFTTTPTTPYNVGDLWLTSLTDANGDIKKCITELLTGDYNSAHWVIASKYTDDTVASQALINASTAQETADGQIQGFFQNDTPTTGMFFGDIWIDTDGHTPPTTADIYRYEDVNHGSQGVLAWNLTSTNAIGIVYLNAYNAQTVANSKITTFYQTGIPTSISIGDYWVDTDDSNHTYRSASIGANEIKTGEWESVRDTSASEDLYTYINTTFPTNIQPQIDGKVETWFYDYAPTLINEPASLWTTDDIKDLHIKDLFYNTITGYAYRFTLDETYQWIRILDSDITTALTNASTAQDTADGKRTVFTAEPITPYYVGDLWLTSLNDADGDIKKCINTRLTGAYVATDWVLASIYATIATNFNNRNDRLSTNPADPVIANDGTAIDHVLNTDGSADISFEWTFNPNSLDIVSYPEYNIDGFIIYVHISTSNSSYTFGTDIVNEKQHILTSEIRALIFPGFPTDKYYTFGIQAYRHVDPDINSAEILKSNIIKSSYAGEDPYQPSSTVAFAGDITGTVAGIAGDSISKTSTTFIIADGSTSLNIKRADYIVPVGATDAQVTINDVIDLLPVNGGKIILLEGTFIIDGDIVLPSNVTIEGQGLNTIIKVKDYTSNDINIFINSDDVNGNENITINNLKLYGNMLTNSNYWGYYGINLAMSNNCKITNCFIIECLSGIDIYSSSSYNIITNNVIDNCTSVGIFLKSSSNVCSNNVCSNNFVGIINWGTDNTINNNVCNNNTNAGMIIGINALNNTITGNVVQYNGEGGIEICGDNNIISSNIVGSNSQNTDNTYDNIIIYSDSNYNNIQNNICRKGSLANKPCYGINIFTSDCNGNIVTNNDLYDSGVTGSFSDSGTGTIMVAGNRV